MSSNQNQQSRTMREAFSRFKTSTTLLRRTRSAPKLATALVLLSSVATATFVFCVPSQNVLHAQTLSTAQPSSPRVDSGPAEPTLTLSPQDKARIRVEEIFREEVRREIEANNPKQSPQDNAGQSSTRPLRCGSCLPLSSLASQRLLPGIRKAIARACKKTRFKDASRQKSAAVSPKG